MKPGAPTIHWAELQKFYVSRVCYILGIDAQKTNKWSKNLTKGRIAEEGTDFARPQCNVHDTD